MIKIKYSILFLLLFVAINLHAQQNPSFRVYRTYQAAGDLLERSMFAAASAQYKLVMDTKLKTSNQPQFESELSLLKENAQYYVALCALELGNDDAENMFLKFIREHPENPLSKLAIYQIGRTYSKQGKYKESLVWFDKITAGQLSGRDNTEYKFRKGYALFTQNDYPAAQVLFGEVKTRRSPFMDDATY
jgi:tetratricopeptide (TPR) repeat protein